MDLPLWTADLKPFKVPGAVGGKVPLQQLLFPPSVQQHKQKSLPLGLIYFCSLLEKKAVLTKLVGTFSHGLMCYCVTVSCNLMAN